MRSSLDKAILLAIISLSIISSIAQLVAALIALAAAQEVNNIRDQSLIGKSFYIYLPCLILNYFIRYKELGAIIMLIMALIRFTIVLIAISGIIGDNLIVMSVLSFVISCLVTIISIITGSGGLQVLIIVLNVSIAGLTAIFFYLSLRYVKN